MSSSIREHRPGFTILTRYLLNGLEPWMERNLTATGRRERHTRHVVVSGGSAWFDLASASPLVEPMDDVQGGHLKFEQKKIRRQTRRLARWRGRFKQAALVVAFFAMLDFGRDNKRLLGDLEHGITS